MIIVPVLLVTFTTLSQSAQPGEKFDHELARLALDYAAASYADDPWPCLRKHNASLVVQTNVSCDAVRDRCWAIVVNAQKHIVVAFQGTSSKEQLIAELIETVTSPKHYIPGVGSVERYFFVALKSIAQTLAEKVFKLWVQHPEKTLLFTGHSLGGALASLAAALYTSENAIPSDKVALVTFGQPRVGNYEYAMSMDRLVPNSWRLVHARDLVAHIPYCISIRSCRDFLNHSPYHHGTEVWYKTGMDSRSVYRVCDGQPEDEDNSCSNNQYFYNIDDHLRYFELHVSDYGIAGCQEPLNEDTVVQALNEELNDEQLELELKKLGRAAHRRRLRDYRAYLRDPRRSRRNESNRV